MSTPVDEAVPVSVGHETAFAVIFAISFCHLLNDMMQSLLAAIYPNLKAGYHLTFAQLGWLSLAYQLTASILQPVVGLLADRKPAPFSLPAGSLFTALGLLVLSFSHSYWVLIVGASCLGLGSSVFHPEASRVARMAAGGRNTLSQSLFQLGGNTGSAIGPLFAAVVVVRWGQSSLGTFALLSLVSTAVLWNVGVWYKHHGVPRLKAQRAKAKPHPPVPREYVMRGLPILLVLILFAFLLVFAQTSVFAPFIYTLI